MNLILDCVGGSFLQENVKSLAVEGRWILYGLMGGGDVQGDLLRKLMQKRASLIATTLRSRSVQVDECCLFAYPFSRLGLFHYNKTKQIALRKRCIPFKWCLSLNNPLSCPSFPHF